EILGVFFAVVLVASAALTGGVALADPVQEGAAVCDPIDGSACLLPWPNNYFTTADASTATGIRVNVSPLATPRNAAGTPLDPTATPPPPQRTGLLIHPAKNFAEGHRYIVALRNMRDSSGHVISAQPVFAAFLAGEGQPATRQSHYDTDIFPQLRAAGINTSS